MDSKASQRPMNASGPFRPAADIFAIFLAPYFFLPMKAASAPGFLTPGREASEFLSAANLPPEPKGAFLLGIAMFFSILFCKWGFRCAGVLADFAAAAQPAIMC